MRAWLYGEGGRMPYIETSLTGDPKAAWRASERVFRTVARTAARMRENVGRYQVPLTPNPIPNSNPKPRPKPRPKPKPKTKPGARDGARRRGA